MLTKNYFFLPEQPTIFTVATFVNIERGKSEHCPNSYVLDCCLFPYRLTVMALLMLLDARVCPFQEKDALSLGLSVTPGT